MKKQTLILFVALLIIALVLSGSFFAIGWFKGESVHPGETWDYYAKCACTNPKGENTGDYDSSYNCRVLSGEVYLDGPKKYTILTFRDTNVKYNQFGPAHQGKYKIPDNAQPGNYKYKVDCKANNVVIDSISDPLTILKKEDPTCLQDASLCQPYSSCDQAKCNWDGNCYHTWAKYRYCKEDYCGNGKCDTLYHETKTVCPQDCGGDDRVDPDPDPVDPDPECSVASDCDVNAGYTASCKEGVCNYVITPPPSECTIYSDCTQIPGKELVGCIDGICTYDEMGCLDVWTPVCGVDGKTYSNACYAGKEGVAVDYEGECGEDKFWETWLVPIIALIGFVVAVVLVYVWHGGKK